MKTSAASLATLALAAVFLALSLGRAVADPAAIFVGNYGGSNGNGTVPAYSATGAAATGYTTPSGFTSPEGVAYNPANNTLYVADTGANQIRSFDAATGAETQLGFANATGLSHSSGLAISAGVLYVTYTTGYVNQSYNDRILAYNAATGQAVTAGFTSPTGLYSPTGLAVSGATLFIANTGDGTLRAYNLATGTAAAGFTTITGLNVPVGVALFGNDLFVANNFGGTVGEYDATTGLAIKRPSS